jgi:hypothetical protein
LTVRDLRDRDRKSFRHTTDAMKIDQTDVLFCRIIIHSFLSNIPTPPPPPPPPPPKKKTKKKNLKKQFSWVFSFFLSNFLSLFFYFDLRFFNATFNNILVYLVRVIVLSMEETEVPREIPSTLRTPHKKNNITNNSKIIL